MRTFIFLTLAAVFLPVALYWSVVFLYNPDEVPADFRVREESFITTAADASSIHGSVTFAVEPSSGAVAAGRPLLLFVADRNLDRDWNSRAFDFDTGRRLARYLGAAGAHSVRYDHRGTGSSRVSRRSLNDLNLYADDLKAVLDHAAQLRNEIRAGRLYLLAHDSGCDLSLLALQQYAPAETLSGAVFLTCGGPGTMLDHWGAKLLHNMERSGAAPELVDRARREWADFRENDELPQTEDAPAEPPHPDLLAFRASLEYIASEDLRAFRETARTIEFSRGLRRLTDAGVPVLHLAGGSDAELPEPRNTRVNDLASDRYNFVFTADLNHFLKPAAKTYHGFPLVLDRMNPLAPLHKGALQTISDFILTTPER